MPFSQPITFASGTTLDRASQRRGEAAAMLADPAARVLALSSGRVLIDHRGGNPMLGWLPVDSGLLGAARETPVLLGLADGAPRFAADIPPMAGEGPDPRLPEGLAFRDLRSVAAELDPGEATIAAAAKGVLGWHESHPRCARCGEATTPEDGGWRRVCPSCRALHFPRTDPVVIMLVTQGDRCLLGRQSTWPEGIHSCLAGFMEPGETIEDAVRREVWEETRIRVGRVDYVACQPWPFPASLMLGCAGEALTDEITIDPTEIETAFWLTRDDAARMLEGRHPTMAAPRPDAIARALLQGWVMGEIGVF